MQIATFHLKTAGLRISMTLKEMRQTRTCGKESKCCAVLMKYRCKVKGEQVITLQMAQQVKTKKY